MPKPSRICKIYLTIFTIGFLLWFGGSVVRSALAFDMFETGAVFELKSDYEPDIQMHSVYLFGLLATYTGTGYGMAFIGALLLMFHWWKSLRKKGWLFMAFILFFISVPVQGILIYYDIQLNIAIQWDNVSDFLSKPIQDFYVERFKNVTLSTLSGLSFLAVLTSVLYIIWRPLDKSE